MRILLLTIYILTCTLIQAQQTIIGVKEDLDSIPIGDKLSDAFYDSTEEGFYSLGSPIIDQVGHVIFLKSISGASNFIRIQNGERVSYPYRGNLSDYRLTGDRHIDSQQGIQIDTTPLMYADNSLFEYNYREKGIKLTGGYYTFYPAPFGGIYYSEKQKSGIAIVFGVKSPNTEFLVINQSELKAWLSTQSGGFSIGDDGFLYRNEMLWSAVPPAGGSYAERYMGRLMSGHQIWVGGGIGQFCRYITISNSAGQIELTVDLPWAPQLDPRKYGFNPFNYGIGPWGEIYVLIAPYSDETSPWPPKDATSAELVVVRNHLKYFGRLNDGGVRLRKEPNTTSDIVGTYPNKTGFRILETGTMKETIAGQTNVWYKVRLLDGTEGWFFGAFVNNLYDGPDGNPPPWPNVADW